MHVFGPTPPMIWDWLTRKIPIVPGALMVPALRRNGAIANTVLRFWPHYACEGVAAQDDNGLFGLYAAETETHMFYFLTDVWGTGRARGFTLNQHMARLYVDTLAGNYNYRLYVRPAVLNSVGVINDLGAEQLLWTYTRVQAAGAGWTNEQVFQNRSYLLWDVPFNGVLAWKMRLTAWTNSGGNVGHGFAQLNDPQRWLCHQRVLMD